MDCLGRFGMKLPIKIIFYFMPYSVGAAVVNKKN